MSVESLEARVQRLEDIESIKRLMYRYWRCLDQKQWADFPDCFTEDVVADYGMPGSRKIGRDALVAFLYAHESPANFQISHAGHNAEVTLLTADTAQGYFKLHDWVVIGGATAMRGIGQYDITFLRCSDGWRISVLKLNYSYREEHVVYIDNQRVNVTDAMLGKS